MSDKLIDENGRYIDPARRTEQKPEEAGAALAFRVIAKAAKEEILPKKIYRIYMPIIGPTDGEAGHICLHVIALRRHIQHLTSLSIQPQCRLD